MRLSWNYYHCLDWDISCRRRRRVFWCNVILSIIPLQLLRRWGSLAEPVLHSENSAELVAVNSADHQHFLYRKGHASREKRFFTRSTSVEYSKKSISITWGKKHWAHTSYCKMIFKCINSRFTMISNQNAVERDLQILISHYQARRTQLNFRFPI